jgi:Ferroportin1 (FPN1)
MFNHVFFWWVGSCSICVEKDWTTVVAGGDPMALSQLNSTMRRIDLTCDVLAPLAFGKWCLYE